MFWNMVLWVVAFLCKALCEIRWYFRFGEFERHLSACHKPRYMQNNADGFARLKVGCGSLEACASGILVMFERL